MKKSLLALAVLGAFAGVASAQSSVTIYGLVDEAVTKGNGGTSPNSAAGATSTAGAVTKAWSIRDGSSGSRFGLRGNEDLGGGWSAQFLLEHRLNPDTGTQNSAAVFWQGGSYVQITNAAAGSIYMGRWYTPTFWIDFKSDPFAYAGVASLNTLGLANFLTPTPAGPGVRSANTFGYKTPNWGGFTANVASGLSEGSTTNGRDDAANVEYAAGPLWAGAGYERIKGVVTAPAAGSAVDGNKLFNVGVAYDFKFIRPILYYAKSKTGAGSVNDNKLYSIGLTAPVGPGVLKALYANLTPKTPTTELKLKKASVGYDYFLSKRTRVYADFTQVKQDTFTTTRMYAIGARHEF